MSYVQQHLLFTGRRKKNYFLIGSLKNPTLRPIFFFTFIPTEFCEQSKTSSQFLFHMDTLSVNIFKGRKFRDLNRLLFSSSGFFFCFRTCQNNLSLGSQKNGCVTLEGGGCVGSFSVSAIYIVLD